MRLDLLMGAAHNSRRTYSSSEKSITMKRIGIFILVFFLLASILLVYFTSDSVEEKHIVDGGQLVPSFKVNADPVGVAAFTIGDIKSTICIVKECVQMF